MKIETVDFFYLALPEIRCVGDGSQDVLLVRLRAGEWVGWGECEASPLVSIAAWNCPMSHSACQPVSAAVLGQRLDEKGDIARIHRDVRESCLDLLQADHTLSGVEIAMWDLLDRKKGAPVYELLGYRRAHPKIPYASALFGGDPQETLDKARTLRAAGYRGAKFGWGPYGRGDAEADAEQVRAAREGLGNDADLLVDAGTVWGEDAGAARLRLEALRESGVRWLEEPFVSEAFAAYRALGRERGAVPLAGGEGCHRALQAINMMEHAGLSYVQIDTGRVGGIGTAKRVAERADAAGLTFVNHTFTTPLALSVSIQPYAGLERHELCEYPVEASDLARSLTMEPMDLETDGTLRLPEVPGLGLTPSANAIRRYLVEEEICVNGKPFTARPRFECRILSGRSATRRGVVGGLRCGVRIERCLARCLTRGGRH